MKAPAGTKGEQNLGSLPKRIKGTLSLGEAGERIRRVGQNLGSLPKTGQDEGRAVADKALIERRSAPILRERRVEKVRTVPPSSLKSNLASSAKAFADKGNPWVSGEEGLRLYGRNIYIEDTEWDALIWARKVEDRHELPPEQGKPITNSNSRRMATLASIARGKKRIIKC